MQFKNIVATIAALAVASAVASPVAVENGIAAKRDGQEAQQAQAILTAATYANQHAGQLTTQREVDLWNQAALQWGPQWCEYPAPVLYKPCPYPIHYYLACYEAYPTGWDFWHGTYKFNAPDSGSVSIDRSFNENSFNGLFNGDTLDISLLNNLLCSHDCEA